VARVVEALRHPDGELDAAIATVGLSRSHLESLFVRDVGVSIRTYRLWRRLIAAVIGYSRRDATAAAHHAGFADLAHFSRTCRRMLGYSPTALRGSLGEVAHDERNAPRRGARVG
jgi:AraC-like DNA-binding protein